MAENKVNADATGVPLKTAAQVEGTAQHQGRDPAAGSTRRERFNPLFELTLSRVREFLREPEVIFWVFLFPVILAFALGIAFRNTAPEKVYAAVETNNADRNDAATIALASTLSRSGEIVVQILTPEEAAQALRSGKVALVVHATDSGTQTRTSGGAVGASGSLSASSSLSYRYDPTRPESRLARLVVDDTLQRALGRTDVARVGEEKATEPGARYIDFLIPGLLGLNLMGSGLWGVGFAIVSARLRKLLKRLAATPMRRWHYLLSFILSRMIFLILEVALILIFARLMFGYKVQGSYLSMSLLLLVGALTFAGVGLLVAARPQTIEGVSGLMNLVMMPMWLLSGTFFSAARFPGFLQPFIKLLPLTALNDALRAVMNEGSPLAANLIPLSILLGWCVISFALALRLFRWQ